MKRKIIAFTNSLIFLLVVITLGVYSENAYAHMIAQGPEDPGFRDAHPVKNTSNEQSDDLTFGVQPRCVVQGTNGNDVLPVGGNDCVQGLRGDDTITVTDNVHKHLFPDSGSDTVTGGGGIDFIHDGNPRYDPEYRRLPDNDNLNGAGGNDHIFAGFGDDTLTGGPGADTFECGEGQDNITDYNAQDGDTIVDDPNCETK